MYPAFFHPPAQPLHTAQQEVARMLAETRFSVRAPALDQKRKYCWKNIDAMVKHGLMGMTIPEEYGGKGATLYEACLVAEEIARHCTLTARVFVEANMGAIGAIMLYGTHEQKQLCASLVLKGDKPAICMSEPHAQNAANQMLTTARRQGSSYILNGHKHWITGGGISKLHLVFARVQDERGNDEGMGAFLVIRDRTCGIDPEGFRITGHEDTLGLRGMPETRIEFNNLEVASHMRLETPDGFSDLMAVYNAQRIGAGVIAMGVASAALDEAKHHMHERASSGHLLAELQGLQGIIADMDTAVYTSRLLLHEAAKSTGPFAHHTPDATMAARAKLFASEAALKVINQAFQIFGARGFRVEEKMERMYRDVRMLTIGGGTAEMLRNQIATSVLAFKTPKPCNEDPRALHTKTRTTAFIEAAE